MQTTIGVGGSIIVEELQKIRPIRNDIESIQKEEFQDRIHKVSQLLQEQEVAAMYVHAGTNLFYFTGMKWNSSERMVGALIFPNEEVHYIAPTFEKGTILDYMLIEGKVHTWEEHESPFTLFHQIVKEQNIEKGTIAIDESTPFFIFDGIRNIISNFKYFNAKSITSTCRFIKSENEIIIMQAAMNITLEVQQAVARILFEGISVQEVTDFIEQAHIKYGISTGSYFCIVLFGKDSSFPHGVKNPKNLEMNDVVLIDTGCLLHDYISDITRTYVYGTANEEQRNIWNIERNAQFIAFEAAKIGNSCGSIDIATRSYLEKKGLGPDYALSGLPHRTGHGIGLDIHEWPFLVRSDHTILQAGMCFSIEPMICIPNKFGIRLEDHIYMTDNCPKWFTEPAYAIDDPFGLEK